jgi:hypothetical protein
MEKTDKIFRWKREIYFFFEDKMGMNVVIKDSLFWMLFLADHHQFRSHFVGFCSFVVAISLLYYCMR